VERSTDQVIKPINMEALSKWVGKIPADVVRDMAVIAPMLSRLGYDPHRQPSQLRPAGPQGPGQHQKGPEERLERESWPSSHPPPSMCVGPRSHDLSGVYGELLAFDVVLYRK
ncbi:hypothetical protein KUCAC02_006074, partial [Chaenocephalus aceratus]